MKWLQHSGSRNEANGFDAEQEPVFINETKNTKERTTTSQENEGLTEKLVPLMGRYFEAIHLNTQRRRTDPYGFFLSPSVVVEISHSFFFWKWIKNIGFVSKPCRFSSSQAQER